MDIADPQIAPNITVSESQCLSVSVTDAFGQIEIQTKVRNEEEKLSTMHTFRLLLFRRMFRLSKNMSEHG